MKRITYCGLFAASLILLEACPAKVAPDMPPSPWQIKDGVKVLNLWEVPGIGIRWPECVMMRMPSDLQKKMESEPLDFLRSRKILETAEQVEGRMVVRILDPKKTAANEVLVIGCHDFDTYIAYTTFQVSVIKETEAAAKVK